MGFRCTRCVSAAQTSIFTILRLAADQRTLNVIGWMLSAVDNGEGTATIAGGNGTIWATALQIGELVDTAERVSSIFQISYSAAVASRIDLYTHDSHYQVFDPSETRVLVTHGAYGRDGLLAQLAMVLKTDLTISGALHCQFWSMSMFLSELRSLTMTTTTTKIGPTVRFISSFNEFGVQTDQESFKNKLLKSRNSFMEVYESAKVQLDSSIS